MVALLSALLGFVSSAVPDLFKLFRDGKDRAHEIALLKLQMEYAQTQQSSTHAYQLEAIGVQAEMSEQAALNERLKDNLTGIHWVDALAGSVRPMLTYAFFCLYFLVKCAQFHLLLNPAFPWQTTMSAAQALVALWTEEDIAIFSAVIAFWFGSRAMHKAKRGA